MNDPTPIAKVRSVRPPFPGNKTSGNGDWDELFLVADTTGTYVRGITPPLAGPMFVEVLYKGALIGKWILSHTTTRTNANCLTCGEILHSYVLPCYAHNFVKGNVDDILAHEGYKPIGLDNGYGYHDEENVPMMICMSCKNYQTVINFLSDLTGSKITKSDISNLENGKY